MNQQKETHDRQPKLRETVRNDIRHGNIRRTVLQDFRDLYEFYIDPKTRGRLVLDPVASFADSARPADDLSFIIIKRKA